MPDVQTTKIGRLPVLLLSRNSTIRHLNADIDRNAKAVVAKFDVTRQMFSSLVRIKSTRDMSQVRTLGLDSFDRLERFMQAKVSRVGRHPQSVDHEMPNAREEFPTLLGDVIHIGAVGNISHPKAKYIERPMHQWYRNDCFTQDLKIWSIDSLESK